MDFNIDFNPNSTFCSLGRCVAFIQALALVTASRARTVPLESLAQALTRARLAHLRRTLGPPPHPNRVRGIIRRDIASSLS